LDTRCCYRGCLDHNTLIKNEVRWSITRDPRFVGRGCALFKSSKDLQIPPSLLLYVNVDPLLAVTVDPSPPKTVIFEVGPEVLVGCGALVVLPAPVEPFEALFFGFITVK